MRRQFCLPPVWCGCKCQWKAERRSLRKKQRKLSTLSRGEIEMALSCCAIHAYAPVSEIPLLYTGTSSENRSGK